jgi:predicted DNA-binding transcriptional regulator AlpA
MQEMSAKDCAGLFKVKPKTWYEWCRYDPTAPRPVHHAPRFTRWNEEDVLAYQALLIAENRTGYVKRKEVA